MSKLIKSIPKEDGFRMPGEFEEQEKIIMIWPQRLDNWRDGALPAQKAYAEVARTIAKYVPVIMLASEKEYSHCKEMVREEIRVVEVSSNDAWARDIAPSFLTNGREIRACDWKFNAWGGFVDGLYFPWDQDILVPEKICNIENIDYYKTPDFVLEGGSFHVDGEGTVLTTKMCLLSKGRNPHMTQQEIEKKLCDYLNCEKVLWVTDGIDPDETNGHIDDVAFFIRPGEVACIYTEDEENPFYQQAKAAFMELSEMEDAKGRRLKVHRICIPKKPVTIESSFQYYFDEDSKKREVGEICIASYANSLIINSAVIVPQYGDEMDVRALQDYRDIFPDKEIIGVYTREIVYGGGNIHCITQQIPKVHKS